MRRSSVGTANSGVPRNTMCKRRPSRPCGFHSLFPLARLLQFPDFAFDQIAFESAQVIDKQDSIQVIDLVQERPRKQVVSGDLKGLAFHVARAHSCPSGPAHGLAEARDAETSLLSCLL